MKVYRPHLGDAFFLVSAAVVCFSRFRFGLTPLQTYDDDFFYYLRASRNLLATGRSTFDGVHLTNGYHPLWFAVLTMLAMITPARFFFVALQATEFALAGATYWTLRGVFRRMTPHRCNTDTSACIAAVMGLTLARGGMEIALIFPLFSAWMWLRFHPSFRWQPGWCAAYGALLSLVVLSRLDTILLIGLIVPIDFAAIWQGTRARVACVSAFVGGSILLPVYFATNRYWFHAWMPVSGAAKQLRRHHWPSTEAMRSVFLVHSLPLQTLLWLALLLTFTAAHKYRQCPLDQAKKRIAAVLLAFPFVHLGIIVVLSDWTVWPWYFYPFVLSLLGSATILLAQSTERQERLAQRREVWMLTTLLLFAVGVSRLSGPAEGRYRENLSLAQFIDSHPGTYAMGDVSGMLSYMVNQPMVQTEGLMEDRAFLDSIRREEFVGSVLQRYRVDYYIPHPSDQPVPYYAVQEPAQAGADSPKLYGFVCRDKALFQPGTVSTHQVFALHDVTDKPRSCGG